MNVKYTFSRRMADPPDLSVLKYENDQEEVCSYVSHEPLPAARRAVYAKTVPVFAAADGVFFSVTTKSPDGTAREFIVNCKAGSSGSVWLFTFVVVLVPHYHEDCVVVVTNQKGGRAEDRFR